jgi:hypothetical protein
VQAAREGRGPLRQQAVRCLWDCRLSITRAKRTARQPTILFFAPSMFLNLLLPSDMTIRVG